ncbi:hypothetical protein Tco_0961635 [Tanacetum coccineum]
MSFITAQQTKLDLELVPKENRFDIEKCNGIIPRGFSPREPTFQATLDAIALTPCYPTFLITVDVPKVYMHQFWNSVYKHADFYRFKIDKKKRFKLTLEVFRDIFQICPRVQDKDFDALPTKKTLYAYHERLVVLTSFVSLKHKSFGMKNLSQKANESRDLSRSLQLSKQHVSSSESLRWKKSKGKEKEKVDVAHGKGIELLSEVALTEGAQLKEVSKKSLRDFHKTHPSGSGTVSEKPQSVEKITPTVTSEGTGDKPGVPDVTEDDSTKSESESWGNDEDDSNNEQEASDEGSGQENESEEQESDSEQDKEYDDDNQEEEETLNLEGTHLDRHPKRYSGKGANVEMNEAQQGNENLETTQEQVVDDAHVTITTVTKKTEVPVTSSSHLSDLASKFLIFLDIPQTDA